MEIFKEAKTAVNFASYYPLLHTATADNDDSCPGYVYEEIIKLSHLSPGHRVHLIDFLLTRLRLSGTSGQQKVVNVLRRVTEKGHPSTRRLLRQRDQQLRAIGGPRHAITAGGGPAPGSCLEEGGFGGAGVPGSSPRHGAGGDKSSSSSSSYLLPSTRTPQLLLHGAVQELLAELFDPELISSDLERERLGECSAGTTSLAGMGSSSAGSSKYQGFGSFDARPSPTVINKVRGLVDRILWPDVKELSPTAKAILEPDYGGYLPFVIPTEHLPELAPYLQYPPAVGPARGGVSVATYRTSSGSGRSAALLFDRSSARSSSERYLPAPALHDSVMGKSQYQSSARTTSRSGDTSSSSVGSTAVPSSSRRATGRSHRAGRAGGGWAEAEEEQEATGQENRKIDIPSNSSFGNPQLGLENYIPGIDNLERSQISGFDNLQIGRSVSECSDSSFHQTGGLLAGGNPALGSLSSLRVNVSNCPSSDNLTVMNRSASRSVSTREEDFLGEFFVDCTQWPIPYDEFSDKCNECATMDCKSLLDRIAALFYPWLPSQHSDVSFVTTKQLTVENVDADAPTKIPYHLQMALLTLIDFCIHDDVFCPLVVRDAMMTVLQRLQEDSTVTSAAKARAKKITLTIHQLVQICDSRSG